MLLHTKGPNHQNCLIRPLGSCLEFGNDTVLTGPAPLAENCLLPMFTSSVLPEHLYIVLGWDDFREKADVGNTEVSSESLGGVALLDLSVHMIDRK